jgi:hypothetical protein
MRRNSFVVALAAVAVAAPLSAQTWQTIGANSNNNAAYWGNTSDDNTSATGAICNAGAVLTGYSTAAMCSNLGSAFLPTSTGLTTSNVFLGGAAGAAPGAFNFSCAAGSSCTINFLGRIEGVPSTWGVVTSTGTVFNGDGPINIAGGTTFAMFLRQSLPSAGIGTAFTSMLNSSAAPTYGIGTANQQFAVFTNAATAGQSITPSGGVSTINVLNGQRYWVGMEDNVSGGPRPGFGQSGTPFSDRDYNDMFVSITATNVPEPATVGLMGFGLLALAGIAKRRKA